MIEKKLIGVFRRSVRAASLRESRITAEICAARKRDAEAEKEMNGQGLVYAVQRTERVSGGWNDTHSEIFLLHGRKKVLIKKVDGSIYSLVEHEGDIYFSLSHKEGGVSINKLLENSELRKISTINPTERESFYMNELFLVLSKGRLYGSSWSFLGDTYLDRVLLDMRENPEDHTIIDSVCSGLGGVFISYGETITHVSSLDGSIKKKRVAGVRTEGKIADIAFHNGQLFYVSSKGLHPNEGYDLNLIDFEKRVKRQVGYVYREYSPKLASCNGLLYMGDSELNRLDLTRYPAELNLITSVRQNDQLLDNVSAMCAVSPELKQRILARAA